VKKGRESYQILLRLIREIITDRFKSLARDELLSKFIAGHTDPALLVDHALQAERESLDLAEMSLFTLITSDLLDMELRKSAVKIQESLKRVYVEDVSKSYLTEGVQAARVGWIRARVDFYARWLSTQSSALTATELVRDVFRRQGGFDERLTKLFESEKILNDEIVRATPPIFRLLMTKQLGLDLERSKEIWAEFAGDAFKETKALPE